MNKQRIVSHMGWTTPDTITVRGKDLTGELMGHVNLGDMAFLELLGRLPKEGESVLFNAMLVSLVEHGTTPSTLAARLTYLGAPEALQGAVAAGLLGVGSVFVGTIEGAAKMLYDALNDAQDDVDLDATAQAVVAQFRAERRHIPGIGHPIHKPEDPRATRLFALAAEYGLAGRYVTLMTAVAREAASQSGRVLPLNATGAIGALACQMGIPWEICRGLGVMARAIGLVGHLLEESTSPMAGEIWRRTDEEARPESGS
jgi:citrate synthase